MKRLTALIIMLAMIMSFVGCAGDDGTAQISTITDFKRFAEMSRDTDRIDVTFDTLSGYPFYFTIEDSNDIEEVMNIIFSSSLNKLGEEVNDGNHTYIKIVQGDDTYTMSVSSNKEGKYYYSFSSTDLADKITILAIEAGVYGDLE